MILFIFLILFRVLKDIFLIIISIEFLMGIFLFLKLFYVLYIEFLRVFGISGGDGIVFIDFSWNGIVFELLFYSLSYFFDLILRLLIWILIVVII